MRHGLGVVMAAVLALGACSAPTRGPSVEVSSAQYDAAFDAARRALLSQRFELERVDAVMGVITTRPKGTAGLLTPWDTEQRSAGDELGDAAHDQRRVVRVTFEPAEGREEAEVAAPGEAVEGVRDVREAGALTMRVRVVVERRITPGRRVEAESIRRSSRWLDADLASREIAPLAYVPVDEDPALARVLAEHIRRALR